MTATTNAEIDESLFFLEQLARDHHNDGAPETALYINRAATMLRALRDQREETIAKLADPAAVVANMMRGHIAKPDFRAFLSIYGEVFNDLEAANIANIELRDQREADAVTPDDLLRSLDKWATENTKEREILAYRDGWTNCRNAHIARAAMSAQGEK